MRGELRGLVLLLCLVSIKWVNSDPTKEQFLSCMSAQFIVSPVKTLESFVHSPDSQTYTNFFQSSAPNPGWLSLNFTSQKPLFIVTPTRIPEIQRSVLCGKKLGLQVRTRSGGHDYEGLSYLSESPFIILDLVSFRAIQVDLAEESAWIQSGATIGELYYNIAKMSKIHGFPAGTCPSVGVGGHFSGGGFGSMMRKHGLAADNVIDARFMDADGRIHDRRTMGEDLFWAIRGGGAASFGVVLSWKIKLVRVPEKVTCFVSHHTIRQNLTKLVHKWQYIAAELHEDLFIRAILYNAGGSPKTVQATFQALFLGGIDGLIPLMNRDFPELGLRPQDCAETSWIDSILFFSWKRGQPPEVLLDRKERYNDLYFKAKSDFVQNPVPETALEGVWKRFLEEENPVVVMEPLGGRMYGFSETETPFPHRRGNLYNIQYMVKWRVNGVEEMNKHVTWMRMLYEYMTPYVSRSPRGAYLNYRDLDLGRDNGANTSFADASRWGERYFKGNFKRLALVKGKVDPGNFFRNEQSIPPLQRQQKKRH
ncbi:PREDICTED: inactive tetrahydrocannabinolic acid synthase [Tarenaya hassleriana]|uniref:inactive tetrahydrocannabinolic acid synthase n=1 Tax=Tarenaya hassleriana TaxID=28532 RepID=UPI00053C3D17|nr:PREDICTED: inactive tetrahydrocannabinolic acid synthase [Tarenaya hassleriana]